LETEDPSRLSDAIPAAPVTQVTADGDGRCIRLQLSSINLAQALTHPDPGPRSVMEVTVTISFSTIRNVFGGIVIAASISFVSTELSAGSCPVSTPCEEGTPLYPFEIECACGPQSGNCSVIEIGESIRCECGSGTIDCNCDDGCGPAGR